VQSSTFTLSVEGVASAIITPFQKVYNLAQNGVHMLWAGLTELGDVRDELKKAQQKIIKYESITEELSNIKKENEQLRFLLKMKPRIVYDSIPAKIISKDPDNWFRTIIINRGYSDGVKINMPVIAFNGDQKAVVGKVIEVNRSLSRIIPVVSPKMKLGVMLNESQSPGLMKGYSSNSCLSQVDYIMKSEQVKINDLIVTSGQADVFPKGLLIGSVTKVVELKTNAFKRIIVKPLIDYNNLSEVFIIKKTPNKEFTDLIEGTK
jgi:rod shape-determining protein MreC